jgi:hypothetical protein
MSNFKTLFLISAAVLFFNVSYSATSLSLNSFFTVNEKRYAVNGEFLTSVSLAGKGEVHSNGIENSFPVRNSYITASSSNYDMAAVEKGFFYMDGNSSGREKIFRSLTDFSTLKGMVYYSQTSGSSSTLILDSWKIQSQDDYIKVNVKDKTIPESARSHFAIKDNRLGLLTFKSEFIASGENFIMINTSTGTSSRFGMKIFYPGDYRIYKILIYDKNLKGYYFYTAQFMKVRSSILSKMDLIKPESFANRVRAESIHFLKSLGVDRSGKLAAFK